MVENGTHYRATATEYPDGVYRVVGSAEEVALLRVTDGEGHRRPTGHLVRVPESELGSAFEPAEDPDAGVDPLRGVRNLLTGLYWSVRRFF